MLLSLFALFVTAFAFGTTEFVIAGVLPEVAGGLGVSIPTAGYLVSGYALGIAVGGPLLTLATGAVSRRALLIAVAIAFTIGQAACALAPGFASMMALRVAVAFAHGAVFGVAMVVATGLVSPEKRGTAVAIILAGLTVSGIIGVPAGTAIGALFGWRATFWAMFGLGIVSVAAMIALLPATPSGPVQTKPSLGDEVRVLGRQQVWTCLIIMLMLMMAQFVPYTYVAPLLQQVTGLDETTVPWVLLLCGIGSTLGVFVGGRFSDRRLMHALIAMPLLQAVVLALMYLAAPYPVPMVAAMTLWSAINFCIGTPVQTRILTWTADAPNLASSLIPSGFNVGIALAAFVGSVLLNSGYPYRGLPLIGVGTMLVAATVALLSHLAEQRRGVSPPQPANGRA